MEKQAPIDSSDRLVLWDFDGTLTRVDTLWPFLLYVRGWWALLALAPTVAVRLAGLKIFGKWSTGRAKEMVLEKALGGWTRGALEDKGASFAREKLPVLFRKETMKLMRDFHQKGFVQCVVSASMEWWLMPFCLEHGLLLECTRPAYDASGRFTGRLEGPNCKGPEKKRRILSRFELQSYREIEAFGNSAGDREMWEVATRAWRVTARGSVAPVVVNGN